MDSGPLVQANTSTVREMQPAGVDFGRPIGPRVYPELKESRRLDGWFIAREPSHKYVSVSPIF